MSVYSSDATHGGRSLVSEALRWALPRFGIYLSAAFTSVMAFTVWAVVYTYVWPGKRIEPTPSLQVPSPVVAPATPAPRSLPKPRTDEGALIASLGPDAMSLRHWYKQNVHDSSNNKVGEIMDVLIDRNGNVTALIIGVGGFLGAGEKDVAVPFQSVQIRKNNNDEPRLVINSTKDVLKNAKGFKYDRTNMSWIPEDAALTGPLPAPTPR